MEEKLVKKNSVKIVNFGMYSLGTRLFFAVMAAASIGLGSLGTLFYRELKSVRLLQLIRETEIKVRELDAEIHSSESFLKSLVAATNFLQERGDRAPEAYEQLVLSFMPARPKLITGFGIMQLPYGLVDRQWFGPYIEESRPNRGVKLSENPDLSLVELWQVDKYPQLQYYQDPVKKNEYFWSEPYLNKVYPIPLMTFAGPIRDRQGKLIAIMNGDINLRDLHQIKESLVFDDERYYVLVTQKGTLLSYSPDPTKAAKLENIASISALKLVWDEIRRELNQAKSQGYLKSNSTKSYWVYQKVPSSQWIMLQAIPYKVVINPALFGATIATLIAGIILALVVLLFVRSLNHRLEPILNVCDRGIIDRDNSLKPQDEISRLSNAFFSMVKQQNALMEQLQQTNQELVRATRLKDEFLANMSHEFRTPLNAILGLSEALQDRVFGEMNERQLKALRTIERSGFDLLELINDILDLAQIEAGQMELECVPISVAHLCQSSIGSIEQQARQKNIQLETKLPFNLPDLLVDERRIRKALINLLNNAVKFTPSGGQITLEVSHQNYADPDSPNAALQNYLRITVRDTGIGIAPEKLDELFQLFSQIDSALNRKYAGTGLGLALVKRLVELHGGRVGLTSELGVGSCFTIDLPCTSCVRREENG